MKKIIILFLTIMLSLPAFAGEEKTGGAGFAFLKVPIGARETAMGSAGIVSSMGASAVFWNPANISAGEGFSFSGSYLNHFAGISSQYGAIAFPMGEIGTFALALNYFDYGDITRTTEANPTPQGTFSPFEMAVMLGYSKRITDRVSGGLNVKFIRSDIAEVSANALAFDFGFTYATGYRGLKLGFVIQNIGPQAQYTGDGLIREITVDDFNSGGTEIAFVKYGSEPFDLPASVNLGASFELYKDEQNSIMGMIDQNINSFSASRTNLGAEYGYNDMFFARVGYNTTWERDLDARTGEAPWAYFSAGAGVKYNVGERYNLTIDYGYLDYGQLDATHRFSVGINF